MRIDLGPKSLVYPEPVLVIGTYNDDDTCNAMTAAWGGVSDTNEIMICLSESHRTTKNILKRKDFTVAFATAEKHNECDYVGMVSGNDEKEKVEKCGFTSAKASKVDAPLFNELPVALECRLKSYDKDTGHLFADILNVSVDEGVTSDGKVDLEKFHPIIYDGLNHTYNKIGEKVGEAYKDYKNLTR